MSQIEIVPSSPDISNLGIEDSRWLFENFQSIKEKLEAAILFPGTAVIGPTGQGTIASGDVTDLLVPDGNYLTLDEVAGAPGFELVFTFSNVKHFAGGTIIGHYEGSAAHNVYLKLYNPVTLVYDVIQQFFSSTEDEVVNFRVPSDVYISSAEEVIFTFLHPTSGVGTHNLFLDYFGLEQY